MIDPAYARDHLDEVRAAYRNRGLDADSDLEHLATLETRRRRLIPEVEGLKREQNAAGDEVARAKRQGHDATPLFAASKARAQHIRQLEIQLDQTEQQRAALLMTLPNLPHATVPIGRSSADNQEVRRNGEPRRFDFDPKPHWELGAALGILDFERATRMSGARFSVLMGMGAKLARALINFMLDVHTREHGYTEVEPPFLVNAAALRGTGNLPKFEQDLFKIGGDWDLFLIPTAEVPLTNLHRDEIIDGRLLPIRYTAYTPCFRSEAGSYGADVRGLIRQHQFDKVELVKFTTPDQSYDELESLTRNAESILERLGLPYRTVALCTGDMGFAAAKTYDIEVWLPSQQMYREISSCSNTEAFQARRANIKFRSAGTGKAEFAHTLNGSGLAVGRTLIAILENYQQRDGSVVVPDALRPYLNGTDAIARL
ncbi:MAG TPA: serine--tRNA ligase [Vicinamibacterales bacterium]